MKNKIKYEIVHYKNKNEELFFIIKHFENGEISQDLSLFKTRSDAEQYIIKQGGHI